MSDEVAPKRRGRPPQREGERKGGNLTIRTYGDLREQLEAAAKASGRSVSGEVEFRLEQSFRDGEIIYKTTEEAVNRVVDKTHEMIWDKAGGFITHEAGTDYGRILRYVMSTIGCSPGDKWYSDVKTVQSIKDKMAPASSHIIDCLAENLAQRNRQLTDEEKAAVLKELNAAPARLV